MIRRFLPLFVLLFWSQAALALGVNFTSPAQTTYLHSASFTVSAKATAFQDGEWVTSLKLYRDGVLIGSGATSASASVSGLPVGTYTFTATGTNNWGQVLSKTLTVTVNPSKVTGYIDGVANDASGTPHVAGWACSTGLNQSIDVHTYLGGGWPAGTNVDGRTANLPSEAAVAAACQAQGTAYRFSIPLTQAIRDAHGGKPIYVHGISPVGQPNDLIANSGVFVVPTSRNAAFVAQSVPTTMVAGQSYAVVVQMRNEGSAVWRPAEGYRLGIVNVPGSTWGLSRVELSGDIAKGATSQLAFTAKAPSSAGTYNFQWRMLQEGVEWFGATTPNVAVRVVSGNIAGSPNPCTIPYGASTCTATISWTSTAGDAEVWVTDANDGNAQLFARAQSGSLNATNVTQAGSRFHLKAAGQTMAVVHVAGTPASNVAPTVQLTAPTPGNNGIAPASVALAATAADADDGVDSVSFYANGALLHTDPDAPYAFTWTDVPAGNYNVHAVARDKRNAMTTSAAVAISIVAPVANPTSSTRHYIYDQHQRLCKVVEPETRATVMQYDAAGNLAWSASGLELLSTAQSVAQCESDRANADASGRAVRRSYDARNRLQHLRFPDGRGDQDWTYTPTGQPKTITTSNDGPGQALVVNTYDYNRRGLLIGESSGQPNWYSWGVGYSYHRNGHQQGVRYPTGLYVDFGTNALGQPTLVQSDLGVYASGIQYHPNGSIRQFTYGNGIVHTMRQNARQLPEHVASSGGVLDYTYAFDLNGNVGAIYDVARGPSFDRTMTYDGLDRLLTATSPHFGGDGTHRYTYDKLDNLTS